MLMPVKFKRFRKEYRGRAFTLLDVGCGNHSPTVTKKYFPASRYHGLDHAVYNNDDADLAAMDMFYEIDLETGDLTEVPDGFFDVILFVHVIEHLSNGLEVLSRLSGKLKPGGKLYAEFPSIASLGLPSAEGTLHFCDDPTHVRLYGLRDVANALLENDMTILKAGRRRDMPRVLLYPLVVVRNLLRRLRGRKIHSKGMWDFHGFADFVYAQRTEHRRPGHR